MDWIFSGRKPRQFLSALQVSVATKTARQARLLQGLGPCSLVLSITNNHCRNLRNDDVGDTERCAGAVLALEGPDCHDANVCGFVLSDVSCHGMGLAATRCRQNQSPTSPRRNFSKPCLVGSGNSLGHDITRK